MKSSVPNHKNNSDIDLSSSGRSGDHDMLVPFLATQDWIRSLNYSIIDHWRPWLVHNQVAGNIYVKIINLFSLQNTKTYANKMTFATVKASLRFSYYLNEKFIVGRVSHFFVGLVYRAAGTR
ncbi:hypothetical protein IGI04_012198 [Brassica rapa subsp. trilocularis]|uniref:DUF4283 domain-containing protein n=1 Tax=Brassica rapa subsp. trilocularis TaxID=1813537 RepID=A0ABQ7N8I5_BRACM|nr:hypothetical protein IGI04_012198 [Brassica rapa subsp. trilocularis]